MSSRRDLIGALSSLLRLTESSDDIGAVRNGSIAANARNVLARAERGLIEQAPWTAFVERPPMPPNAAQLKAVMAQHQCSEADARAIFQCHAQGRLFVNARYQVLVRRTGETTVHLSIKRLDQMPIHDWRDLQRCKDELVGPECEAVELYPAQSRVMDTANQYHLWAVSDPQFRFPLGWRDGHTSGADEADATGAGQRPITESG